MFFYNFYDVVYSGLGKIKPQWLYNIGSPKVEQFDGTTWTEMPSMNRAKVEHGCTVATIEVFFSLF